MKFANEHPETGFPFVVYSTGVLTHLALKQPDEAERFANTAMAEARAGDRRIKEIELSLMLAQIAEKRGRPEQVIAHPEQAVATAKAGRVQRLLAEAESDLADTHRAQGDLSQALRYVSAAVAEMSWVACLADARSAAAYSEWLTDEGFTETVVENHDEVLTDMIRGIGTRLFATEVLAGLVGWISPALTWRRPSA